MDYLHRLQEIEYQLLNDFEFQLSDVEKVMAAQNILRTVILEAKANGERVELSDLSKRPTSFFGTTITWDETDYEKDTFTVKLGDIEVTQDVDSPLSLVIDYSDDISDWEAVNIAFQKVKPVFERETDSVNNITGFITLQSTSELDTTVVWDVSNAAGINSDGSIVRPNPGDGDAIGYLYARIEKGDKGIIKIFETRVLERKLSSAEVVALDYDWLDIGYQGSEFNLSVAHDLTLPTLGYNYAEITWTSNHPNITNEGVVTRPSEGEDPVYGELFAQLKSSGYTQDKVFTIKVEPEGENIKSWGLDIEDNPFDNIDIFSNFNPTRTQVAGDHDYLAFSDRTFSSNQGRIYVYRENGNSFEQEAFIDGESGDYLGTVLKANGNFIIASSSNAVKVYQYHAGVWNLNQEILPEDGENFNISKIEINDNFFMAFSSNDKVYVYRRYETGWERIFEVDTYDNEFSFRDETLFTKELNEEDEINIVVRRRNFYDEFPNIQIINKSDYSFNVDIDLDTPLFFDGERLAFKAKQYELIRYGSGSPVSSPNFFKMNSEGVFEYEKIMADDYAQATSGNSRSDYIHNIYNATEHHYEVALNDFSDGFVITGYDIVSANSKTFITKRNTSLMKTKNYFLNTSGDVYRIYKNVFDKDGRKFDFIDLKQETPSKGISKQSNFRSGIIENGDFLMFRDDDEACNYRVYKKDVNGKYNIQVDTTDWPALPTTLSVKHNYFYSYSVLSISIYETDPDTDSISLVLDVDFQDAIPTATANWSRRAQPSFNEDLTLFSFNLDYTYGRFYSIENNNSHYLAVVAFFTIENDQPKYLSYIQGYRYHNYENMRYFMFGDTFYNHNSQHEHPYSGEREPRFEIWKYGDTSSKAKINTKMRAQLDKDTEIPWGDTYDININVDGEDQNISFYLQEITRAYQELGLTGITPETDSGLTEELYYDFVINGDVYEVQAEPDIDAEKEETDITTVPDTLRSLDAKHFIMNSNDGTYYIWYHLDAAPADVFGSVDMTSGYDWKDDSKNFIINYKDEGDINILLDAKTTNMSAMLSAINSVFTNKSLDSKVEAYDAGNNHVGFRTKVADGDETFTLTAGTKDLLSEFGFTEGTYTGTYTTSGYEDINLDGLGDLSNESGLTVGQTYDINFNLNGTDRSGSFYLQEETSGYQELGLTGETSTDSSGIGVGTFDINISVDGQTSQNYSIVMEPAYPASVVGTVDMTSGYDWYDYREYINISVNGASSFQVPFETNFQTLSEIVNHINSVFTTNSTDSEIEAFEDDTNIGIRTVSNGADQTFTITAGDPDASETLGLTLGTYDGVDATSGYEDINLDNSISQSNDSGLTRGQTYDVDATIDGTLQNVSFYLQEATSGYQELGLTGVTPTTDTLLDVGDYDVNINIDSVSSNPSFTIHPAEPASHIGSNDLSSGYNWTNDNRDFNLNNENINLTQNHSTLSDIVNDINNQITSDSEAFVDGNYIGIRTTTTGSTAQLDFGAGTADALTVLGLSEGTYSGVDATSGHEDINLNGMAVSEDDSGLTVGQTYDVDATIDGTLQNVSFYLQEATSGYQELGLTGIESTTDTGLIENTTYYLKINSTEYNITTPTGSQTWGDVLPVLNNQTTGFTWSIEGGDVRATNDTTGSTSTVSITEGTTGDDFLAATSSTPENSVDGLDNDSTTFGFVIDKLNSNTSGATWSIESGDIRLKSDSLGSSSTVSLSNGTNDLVSQLNHIQTTQFIDSYSGEDAKGTQQIGTEDLSNGFDFSDKREVLTLDSNDYTLTNDTQNISEIINHINSLIPSELEAFSDNDTNVGIRTVSYGSEQSLSIGSSTSLGFTVDTYTGVDKTDTTWSNILTLLNDNTSGASWFIDDEDVRVTSGSKGSSSKISITAGTNDFLAATSSTPENSVDGLDADPKTYGDIVSRLNNNTSGATWSIESGNIRLKSDSLGSSSTVSLSNGTNDLVSNLNNIQTTQFVNTYNGVDSEPAKHSSTTFNGYDFTDRREPIYISGTPYTLNATTTSLSEVVSHIDARLPFGLKVFADGNFVRIETRDTGSGQSFTIDSGEAAETLGIDVGTYTGVDKTDNSWSNIISLLNDEISDATWSLESGDVRLTSNSKSSSSTISMSAGTTNDLLSEIGSTPESSVSGLDNDDTTYQGLINKLNNNTSGCTWSMEDGNIRLTSDSFGDSSTVSLSNGTTNDLVAELTDIQTPQFINTYNGADATRGDTGESTLDASVTHDFTDKREDLIIDSIIYTLDATTTNLSEVVSHIESKLPSSFEVFESNNNVGIRTTTVGLSETFNIGDSVAASTLGFDLGDYFGHDESVDPEAEENSIRVDISENDSADIVAQKTQTAIDSSPSFNATVSNNIVSVVDSQVGEIDDAYDVDSGVVIDIANQGVTFVAGDQSWENVLSRLNNKTSGKFTWEIVDGDIRVYNDIYGATSSILLEHGTTRDLFTNLTGFSQLEDPVDGIDEDPRRYQDIIDRLNSLTTVNGTWGFEYQDIILTSNSTGVTSSVDISAGTTNDLIQYFVDIEDEGQSFFKQRTLRLKNGVDFYLDETFEIPSGRFYNDYPIVDYHNRIVYIKHGVNPISYMVLKMSEDGNSFERLSDIYFSNSDSEIAEVSNGYIMTAKPGENFYIGYETADPINNFGMIKLFEHNDNHLRELLTLLPHEFPQSGGGYGLGDGMFFIDRNNNLFIGEEDYKDGVVFEYEIPESNEPNIYIDDLRLARTTRTLPDMNENIQVFTTPLHLPLNTTSNLQDFTIYSEDESIAIYDGGWVKPVSMGNTNIVLESPDAQQEVFKLNLNVNDTRILTDNWNNNTKRIKFYQDDPNNVSYGETTYIYDGDVYVSDPDYNGLSGDACGIIYVYSQNDEGEMFLNGKYQGDEAGLRFGNTIDMTKSHGRKILVSNNGDTLTIMREKFGVFSIVQKMSYSNAVVKLMFDKMFISVGNDFWIYKFNDEDSIYQLLQNETDIDFNGINSSVRDIMLFDGIHLYLYGDHTYIAKYYKYNSETDLFEFIGDKTANIEYLNGQMTQEGEERSPYILGNSFVTRNLKTAPYRLDSSALNEWPNGTLFSKDDSFYYTTSDNLNSSNVEYKQGFNFMRNRVETNVLFHDRPREINQYDYYFSLDKTVFSPKDGSIYIFNIDYIKMDSFDLTIEEYPDVNGLKPGKVSIKNIKPDNAYYKSCYFSSSDDSVAYIEPDGTIRPVSEGLITISATSIDGNATGSIDLNIRRSGGINRVDMMAYNIYQYLDSNGKSAFRLTYYDPDDNLYYTLNNDVIWHDDSGFITNPSNYSIMNVFEKVGDEFLLKYMIDGRSSTESYSHSFSGDVNGMLLFKGRSPAVTGKIRNGEEDGQPNIPKFIKFYESFAQIEEKAEEYGINVYPWYIEYVDEDNYTYQNRLDSGNNQYIANYGSSKNKVITIGHYNFYGTFGNDTGCVHVLYYDESSDSDTISNEFIYNQHIEGDTEWERYGWSIAGDNEDYMFVGAPGKNKVYIYKWNDSRKEYVEQEIIQGVGPEYGYYIQYFKLTNKFYVFRIDGSFDTYIFDGSDWVYEQTFNFLKNNITLNSSYKIQYYETDKYKVIMNESLIVFDANGVLLREFDSSTNYITLFVDGDNIYVGDQDNSYIIKIENLNDDEIEYYYNNFIGQELNVDLLNLKSSFKLPEINVQNSSVYWTSSNPSIEIDGNFAIVTRPQPGQPDVSGDIIANVSTPSGYEFQSSANSIVKEYTDEEIVSIDYSNLDIIYQGNEYHLQVGSDITLPSVGGTGETTISWSSSHSNITDSGVVTRQTSGSGWATGLVTATISRNDISRDKVFELTVVEEGDEIKDYYDRISDNIINTGFKVSNSYMHTHGQYLTAVSRLSNHVLSFYKYDGSQLVLIDEYDVQSNVEYTYVSENYVAVFDQSESLLIFGYNDNGLKFKTKINSIMGNNSFSTVYDNNGKLELATNSDNEFWYIYNYDDTNGFKLLDEFRYDKDLMSNPGIPQIRPALSDKYFTFAIRDNSNNQAFVYIYKRLGSGFEFFKTIDTSEISSSYLRPYGKMYINEDSIFAIGNHENLFKFSIIGNEIEVSVSNPKSYIPFEVSSYGIKIGFSPSGIFIGGDRFGGGEYESNVGSLAFFDNNLQPINFVPGPENIINSYFGKAVSEGDSNFVAVANDDGDLTIVERERIFYPFSQYTKESFKPLDVISDADMAASNYYQNRRSISYPYVYSVNNSNDIDVYKYDSSLTLVTSIDYGSTIYFISSDGMYLTISDNTTKVYKNDGSDNYSQIFETTSSDIYSRFSKIYGDYLFVGPGHYTNQNKVEIYKKDASDNFTLIQTISGPDGSDNYYFGSKIDVDGDNVIISDSRCNIPTTYSGSVYVYKNNGSDVFELEATFRGLRSSDYFGVDISIQGDFFTASSNYNGVRIFYNNGSNWIENTFNIHANNNSQVCMKDNILFIGNYDNSFRSQLGEETNGSYGQYNSGKLDIYHIVDDTKRETILSEEYVGFEKFGLLVQNNGDYMIVESDNNLILYDISSTTKNIETKDVLLINETQITARSSGIDINLFYDKFPSYSSELESFSSSDVNIATVDSDGVVSYVSEGTTSIVATSGVETFSLDVTTVDDSTKTTTWSNDMMTYNFETPESIYIVKRANRIFQATYEGIYIYNNDSGDWVFEQKIGNSHYNWSDSPSLDADETGTYVVFISSDRMANVYKFDGSTFKLKVVSKFNVQSVHSVSISQNYLAVSDFYDDNAGTNNGIVKIFENDGTDNYTFLQDLLWESPTTTSQYLGSFIRFYNDSIFVSRSSASYRYDKNQSGNFEPTRYLNSKILNLSTSGFIYSNNDRVYDYDFNEISYNDRSTRTYMFDENFYVNTNHNTYMDDMHIDILDTDYTIDMPIIPLYVKWGEIYENGFILAHSKGLIVFETIPVPPTSFTLKIDGQLDLNGPVSAKVSIDTIQPSDVNTPFILFESLDANIATVTNSGVVSPVSLGQTTIRATSIYDSNVYADIQVDVIQTTGINANAKGEIYRTNNPLLSTTSTDKKLLSVVKQFNSGRPGFIEYDFSGSDVTETEYEIQDTIIPSNSTSYMNIAAYGDRLMVSLHLSGDVISNVFFKYEGGQWVEKQTITISETLQNGGQYWENLKEEKSIDMSSEYAALAVRYYDSNYGWETRIYSYKYDSGSDEWSSCGFINPDENNQRTLGLYEDKIFRGYGGNYNWLTAYKNSSCSWSRIQHETGHGYADKINSGNGFLITNFNSHSYVELYKVDTSSFTHIERFNPGFGDIRDIKIGTNNIYLIASGKIVVSSYDQTGIIDPNTITFGESYSIDEDYDRLYVSDDEKTFITTVDSNMIRYYKFL